MNDLTTLTIEELKQGREETFSEEMLCDIDAELRRREQAQRTPGPWRVNTDHGQLGSVVGPDGYDVAQAQQVPNDPRHERRRANAALIARAPELAAENERLRGLLAECVRVVESAAYSDLTGWDMLTRMGRVTSEAHGCGEYEELALSLTAAIEAAKEAL